ncbi:polyurethanase [Pseudomonas sp. B329]|uniref:polyurethanase n=1 Tax=Pseudomonas sp. B329 TaxID=1553459 RepID=UPI002005E7E5|nr:polyurethanase [Pseudomonas sp. B329]MCK3865565.1 polyurethanase [Pseudomonas sp. B329]
MSVFNYKNYTSSESKDLFNDAMALTQYKIGGSWAPINANQLGYHGPVDLQGIFTGRGAAPTADALVMGKYEDGNLIGIGISFRGTGVGDTPRDSVGDNISNALTAISENYAKDYVKHAFDDLLRDIARYAQSQGLNSNQILVTGHSQGGNGVNSLAVLSADNWGGFYKNSNYVAFASPTQSPGAQVLNIGYENDPVFRVLDGTTLNYTTSLGIHDKPQLSATNNIVSFNDKYVSLQDNSWAGNLGLVVGSAATVLAPNTSGLWGEVAKVTSALLGQQSITNPDSWKAHYIEEYTDGLNRLIDSEFYDLTHKDSTIIISNLSDGKRADTWVEDLNKFAEKHTGSTFIIGSTYNDLLKGGSGNDYIEGGGGDDTFRDGGGYNILLGGDGLNTIQLQKSVKDFSFANDGNGTLYIKDAYGGISMTRDIEILTSTESKSQKYWFFGDRSFDWTESATYHLTDYGLRNGDDFTQYASSVKGDADNNVIKAGAPGDWLFGQAGNDLLLGGKGNHHFIGGTGNDRMVSGGGYDNFLFYDNFGNDTIEGFTIGDKLVFQGIEDIGINYDYHSYVSTDHGDTLLSFGADSVRLVGVGLDQLSSGNVIIC